MNKEKYMEFCKQTYVPIYSQPWWLDCVCGADNWDVWLYETGTANDILAAMPYYIEKRGDYCYITKAPLTQNNGIIFKEMKEGKLCSKEALEEKIINKACDYIKSMNIDVYEQQYMYSFKNWLPFFWRRYTAITRYTYVIEDTTDLDVVWNNFSTNYRKNIKKGSKQCTIERNLDKEVFYKEHEKVFLRQGLPCPFSEEFWGHLYDNCIKQNSGMSMCARNSEGEIESILFIVWDERSVYHLLGGNIPGYQEHQTYARLTWEGIKIASEKGLAYDFEGSVIKRITKSIREYGGVPKQYFRIRKVFNPDIIRTEAEKMIKELEE